MAESSIPVDLFNPGQVFACLGFVEAANVLLGDAEGAFDWSEASATRFHVRAIGEEAPVERVLRFLDQAEAIALAPDGSEAEWTASWGSPPRAFEPAQSYPFPEPSSPATFVCALVHEGQSLSLEHWGDATRRDNVKFWAGSGGYPGAGLARDALALVRGRALEAAPDPFALAADMSSSFRLDWRRDYIPIDAGFSLNKHSSMTPIGFPLVELLAALGLSHARPFRPDRRNKLDYVYGVVGRPQPSALFLSPPILRAALGAVSLPFATRRFRMLLDWPGQENQARAITTVTEEISHDDVEP
jgi:CRISPR-associated protein Csb3